MVELQFEASLIHCGVGAWSDQPETPVWNETLSLPVVDTDADAELLIRILNDDRLGRDEEMGRVV